MFNTIRDRVNEYKQIVYYHTSRDELFVSHMLVTINIFKASLPLELHFTVSVF